MGGEMHDETVWQKTIPKDRDRMQSRLLEWVVGVLLVTLSAWTVQTAYPVPTRFPAFLLESFAISIAFALAVGVLKAATPAGAAFGGMICFLLTYLTGFNLGVLSQTALTPLGVLFLLTFLSTRAGRQKKAPTRAVEDPGGRSASQIIANLSMAAFCVSPLAGVAISRWTVQYCGAGHNALSVFSTMKVMCLAALAEATADTVSSEIGQAFGGNPVMFPTLRSVQRGVDGAVTTLGTLAGIAASSLVAIAGFWAMHLRAREAVIAAAAATCGLFFDSLLGTTLERKGWLGNDLVNFISTAFAATIAAMACRFYI